jgi:hypothetical protein
MLLHISGDYFRFFLNGTGKAFTVVHGFVASCNFREVGHLVVRKSATRDTVITPDLTFEVRER